MPRSKSRCTACGLSLTVLACNVEALFAGDLPPAIEAMVAARAYTPGIVSWSRLDGEGETALQYITRWSKNGDCIFEYRGDDDGWTLHDEKGRGVGRFPRLTLIGDEGVIGFQETGTSAQWWKPGWPPGPVTEPAPLGEVRNVLGAGLWYNDITLEHKFGPAGVLREPLLDGADWTERRAGRLIAVTANVQGGRANITWYIDPERDWNPERVVMKDSEGNVAECRSKLEKFNGRWLPAVTEYYQNGQLQSQIVVSDAAFTNDAPSDFTPGDLGMEPGVVFSMQNADNDQNWTWDGVGVVPRQEFYQAIKEGKRKWGPTFERIRSGQGYDSPYMTEEDRVRLQFKRQQLRLQAYEARRNGAWLAFVTDFIAKHKLDAEQSQKAMAILRDCEEMAAQVYASQKPAVTRAIAALESARTAGDLDKIKAVEAELIQMNTPLDEIFNKQLKPRLNALLTRAQLRAAEPAKP